MTIPANHPVPKAGSIAEIRYLYAFPGESLFQSVHLGQREDIGREACTLSQLKYKAEQEES